MTKRQIYKIANLTKHRIYNTRILQNGESYRRANFTKLLSFPALNGVGGGLPIKQDPLPVQIKKRTATPIFRAFLANTSALNVDEEITYSIGKEAPRPLERTFHRCTGKVSS